MPPLRSYGDPGRVPGCRGENIYVFASSVARVMEVDFMRTFVKYLQLIFCYFKVNLASALEYRASFAVQAFGIAISNASFIFFWWIAFEQLGGRIGGYDFNDVLFLWSIAPTAFGLSYIVFGNMNQITRLIVTGELDTYLLQPKDVLISLLSARTTLSSWGDFFYGFILLAVSQGKNPGVWPAFIIGVILGALLFTAIAVSAHSLTFFLGDASLAGSLGSEFVITFSIYPLGIYPQIVRFLMYSLIPAAFISHIPLQLAKNFSPHLLLIQCAFTVMYCLFAYWLFNKGLARYESGNLIVTRM